MWCGSFDLLDLITDNELWSKAIPGEKSHGSDHSDVKDETTQVMLKHWFLAWSLLLMGRGLTPVVSHQLCSP